MKIRSSRFLFSNAKNIFVFFLFFCSFLSVHALKDYDTIVTQIADSANVLDKYKIQIEDLKLQIKTCEEIKLRLSVDSATFVQQQEKIKSDYGKEIQQIEKKISNDSIKYALENTRLDSLQNLYFQLHDSCSLLLKDEKEYTVQLLVAIQNLRKQNDTLKTTITEKNEQILLFEARLVELSNLRDTLSAVNRSYKRELDDKQALLEEQIKVLQQKEQLLSEKELLYREAISNSNVDKVKLEGLIDVKNEKIQSKEKEIDYLQIQINEKEKNITSQQENLQQIRDERNKYLKLADTLRENLIKTEKELLKIKEELKYTEKRAVEAEAKVAQAVNRKKKVRVIQGLAMKLYRTPDWDIKPESIDGGYQNVIINRNAGNIEFDFITGASVMLYDFTKTKSRYTYDLGLYVGFGGSNLFKNFYVGPSFKFLDFFHFTTGVNIAEYQILAKGLSEGDVLPPGWQIQTVKQWKANVFFSLSLDLEFLSYIGKK